MGEVVKRHRLAAGMTQEQLAQRSGVSLATVRSIESGRVKKPYRLRDVYRALGLVIEEPAAALSDDELIAEVERRYPGFMDRVIRSHSSTSPPSSEARREGLGRTGEKRGEVDQGDATAI